MRYPYSTIHPYRTPLSAFNAGTLDNNTAHRINGNIVQVRVKGVWLGFLWDKLSLPHETSQNYRARHMHTQPGTTPALHRYNLYLANNGKQNAKTQYAILCAYLRNGGTVKLRNSRLSRKFENFELNASHIDARLKPGKNAILVKFPGTRKFRALDDHITRALQFGSLDDTAQYDTPQITVNYSKKPNHQTGWHWITLNSDNPTIEDILTANGAKFSQKRQAYYYIGNDLPGTIAALADIATDDTPAPQGDNKPAPATVAAMTANTDNEPEQITQPATDTPVSIPITVESEDTQPEITIPVHTPKPARKTIVKGTLPALAVMAARATAQNITQRAAGFGSNGFTSIKKHTGTGGTVCQHKQH